MMLILVINLLLSSPLFASEGTYVNDISLGGVRLAEERLPIKLKQFSIQKQMNTEIKTEWNDKSIQWVRLNDVLLMPRAKMTISFEGQSQDFHIRYLNKSFLLQQKGKNVVAEVWVSLFRPEPISIYEHNKVFESISLKIKTMSKKIPKMVIDYSCAPWGVKISGLDDDYLSVGCKFHRVGKFGDEKPQLEILWSSSSYRLKDQSSPPYYASITNSSPVLFEVFNQQGERRVVRIDTKLPSKISRLKLGLGLGPHEFNTRGESSEIKKSTTFSYFFYGNLFLADGVSLRAFNAYTKQDALFNNAGLYYATEIAQILDKRISVTTLIGAQALAFNTADNREFNEIIYPQGGEVVWSHPFGLKNFKLTGGLFIDLSNSYRYQNNWIRFGTNQFIEMNYLKYQKESSLAEMWGLSYGFVL
jgi:hypothetical protein